METIDIELVINKRMDMISRRFKNYSPARLRILGWKEDEISRI